MYFWFLCLDFVLKWSARPRVRASSWLHTAASFGLTSVNIKVPSKSCHCVILQYSFKQLF